MSNNNTGAAELVFVYNADSNIFALASDFVHKTLNPSTYQCQLCMITYGSVKMKREWRDFIRSIPDKATFLHRDEFRKKYPELSDVKLPAVFSDKDGKLRQLISADEINRKKDIPSLIKLVDGKLKRLKQLSYQSIGSRPAIIK